MEDLLEQEYFPPFLQSEFNAKHQVDILTGGQVSHCQAAGSRLQYLFANGADPSQESVNQKSWKYRASRDFLRKFRLKLDPDPRIWIIFLTVPDLGLTTDSDPDSEKYIRIRLIHTGIHNFGHKCGLVRSSFFSLHL